MNANVEKENYETKQNMQQRVKRWDRKKGTVIHLPIFTSYRAWINDE